MGDIQSRKWQITINNPVEKGYTHDSIKQTLAKFKSCVYWCLSDEIGGLTQTQHTHVYMACSSAVRFSTLFKRFEGAHFEVAKDFNPRSSCEERRCFQHFDFCWINFNPRSSCEERQVCALKPFEQCRISIHAPHARSDGS